MPISAVLRRLLPALKVDSQLAKAGKLSVRTLHYPAMLAQPLAAHNAWSGTQADDAPQPQVGSASLEVIAFVCVQLVWSFTGTPCQLCNRARALLKHLGVMPVRTAGQAHQRIATGIYDDVLCLYP